MKILHSGLPIFMRDTDGTLSFEDGLICDGSSSKTVGQMEGLNQKSRFHRQRGTDV